MIPYGADRPNNIFSQDKQKNILNGFGINSIEYVLIVARPVEENNIFEIVRNFSKKKRNHKLVILGDYRDSKGYHKKVLNTAGDEVLFLGAIYEKSILEHCEGDLRRARFVRFVRFVHLLQTFLQP